jgi:hypothetical protein
MIELWVVNSVGVEARNTYTRGAESGEVMRYERNG